MIHHLRISLTALLKLDLKTGPIWNLPTLVLETSSLLGSESVNELHMFLSIHSFLLITSLSLAASSNSEAMNVSDKSRSSAVTPYKHEFWFWFETRNILATHILLLKWFLIFFVEHDVILPKTRISLWNTLRRHLNHDHLEYYFNSLL